MRLNSIASSRKYIAVLCDIIMVAGTNQNPAHQLWCPVHVSVPCFINSVPLILKFFTGRLCLVELESTTSHAVPLTEMLASAW